MGEVELGLYMTSIGKVYSFTTEFLNTTIIMSSTEDINME